MRSNLMKLMVLGIVLMVAVIVIGGITPTAADAPQAAPPTIVLPTPAATRAPRTVTPTSAAAPKAPMRVVATPTRTPTKIAVRQPRSIPGPSGSYSSSFTIQNMATSSASCSYTIYNSTGGTAYTSSTFSIAVGGSNFTYVPSISGLASGQYSAVISCDQQVAAISNFASSNSGGAYKGVDGSAVGTVWYAPMAFNNYYNFYTNFVVQNATSSPVNVTVEIINPSGTVVATQTANNVPAYSFANIEQTGLAGTSANVQYSAKITGTGNIAVEANIFGGDGTADSLKLSAYTPFTSGATTIYAPVIMNNYYGYSTSLNVQNIGTSSTTVTVTYGTGLVASQSVAAKSSAVFYTPSSGLPSGTNTSAKIESSGSQPIIGVVNETNGYKRGASYSTFSGGSLTVRAPIAMKRYFKYNTSINCQNIGTASTNLTINYSNGASSTQNSIAVNTVALFYQPNEAGLPNGFNGSATITSSSQPIVCVINEDQNEPPESTTSFDQGAAYEGLNQ